MLITGTTFNGAAVIALPSDVIPRVRAPRSIEWERKEAVSSNVSPFTGQGQFYDWQQSWWQGQLSFAPMDRWSHDAWVAFIQLCRGPLNVFLIGDPKARKPKGAAATTPGLPVVNGAAQTGYSLSTRGWNHATHSMLMPNDNIQVGNRLYSVCDVVSTDDSGNATIPVWPPLRDQPADGATIIVHNCKGLFRLNADANKDSVNVGNYGLNALSIKEAI